MTLIALQNNFLPTDTASTILPPEGAFSAFVIAAILMAGVGFSAVMAERTGSGTWQLTAFVMLIGAFVCMGGAMRAQGGYNTSVAAASVEDTSNFVSNIESVYDVEVLLSEDEDYAVTPDKKPPLTVVQDGTAYNAFVSQNPDTYEPTLIMVAAGTSDIGEFRRK